MSSKKFESFWSSFDSLQHKINKFKQKEKELTRKLKDYVKEYQNIELEIFKILLTINQIYVIKRENWNKKIKKLLVERTKFQNFLENLIEEKKRIQESENKNKIKILRQTDSIFTSIDKIEYEINELEKIIQFKHLEINEENELIEKIGELERKKREQMDKLTEQIREQQNTEFYKIQKRIGYVKIYLERINEQVNKFYNKRRNSHKNVLNLYKIAKELRYNKNQIKRKLKDNNETLKHYYLDFLEKQQRKSSNGNIVVQELKPNREDRWLAFQKFKQNKIATLLKKQKEGKRLDFYEFKLILEKLKK